MSAPTPPGITPRLTAVLAVACGAIISNIYYAQPLIGSDQPVVASSACTPVKRPG